MIYKHIFFDLDRTIWDFDKNSHETLLEIFDIYNLDQRGVINFDMFISRYQFHNNKLWDLYRKDKINQKDLRRERFQRTLIEFGIIDFGLSEKIGEEYIERCPRKQKLYPHAFETLEYLSKDYTLHIITNGFEETQQIKLKHSDLGKYFNCIVTSEKAGSKKPDIQIFQYALNLANVEPCDAIYVGDNLEVDILGCQNAGIDGVYFNPTFCKHDQYVKFEISCLSQLMEIF